jgi:hypothetical protein
VEFQESDARHGGCELVVAAVGWHGGPECSRRMRACRWRGRKRTAVGLSHRPQAFASDPTRFWPEIHSRGEEWGEGQ